MGGDYFSPFQSVRTFIIAQAAKRMHTHNMWMLLLISLVPLYVLAAAMIVAPEIIHSVLKWWYGCVGHNLEITIKSPTRFARSIRISGVLVLVAALVLTYMLYGTTILQATPQ
jgi:hypothetical protein